MAESQAPSLNQKDDSKSSPVVRQGAEVEELDIFLVTPPKKQQYAMLISQRDEKFGPLTSPEDVGSSEFQNLNHDQKRVILSESKKSSSSKFHQNQINNPHSPDDQIDRKLLFGDLDDSANGETEKKNLINNPLFAHELFKNLHPVFSLEKGEQDVQFLPGNDDGCIQAKTIQNHAIDVFLDQGSPSDTQLREFEANTFFASEFMLGDIPNEDLGLVADQIDNQNLQKTIEQELDRFVELTESHSSGDDKNHKKTTENPIGMVRDIQDSIRMFELKMQQKQHTSSTQPAN